MALKVYARKGRRHLYVRGTVLEQPVNVSAGTDRPDRAEAFAEALTARLWQRGLAGAAASLTFAEAAELYKHGKSNRDKAWIERLVAHFGRHRLVVDVGQAQLDDAARRLYPKADPATVNRAVYTPGAGVVHYAHTLAPKEVPYVRFARPRETQKPMRVPTPAEAARFMAAMQPPYGPAAILFLATSGARISEMCALTWPRVDLARSHAALWEFKTGRPRGVHLKPELVLALAALPEWDPPAPPPGLRRAGAPTAGGPQGGPPSAAPEERREGYVFPWRTRWEFYRAMDQAIAATGMAWITPHRFRHAMATWLRQQGRDPKAIMRVVGWSSLKSVMRYEHMSAAEIAPIVDALPDLTAPQAQPAGAVPPPRRTRDSA